MKRRWHRMDFRITHIFQLRKAIIPNQDFNGSDSFVVTVTDDLGGTTNQSIKVEVIAVDDEATIAGDTEKTGEEDTPITGSLKASDPDGLSDNTYFSIEESDQSSNGIATIDSSNGEWTFKPNQDFNGSDSFVVTVTDDLGGTTKQNIKIEVIPVDDKATIEGDIEKTGEEDTPITGSLKASDPDGLSDNTYFSIEESDQASNGIATIDSSNGEWTFKPNQDFTGSDSFVVTVTDDLGGTTKQKIQINIRATINYTLKTRGEKQL